MLRATPVCHLGLDLVEPQPCIGSRCSAWGQITIADEGPDLGRCGLVRTSAAMRRTWRDPNFNDTDRSTT